MSIHTVEIRLFSGPSQVDVGGASGPDIVEIRQGPIGPAGTGATWAVKSASFTASNDTQYTAVATLTVTDPSPVEGKGFEVFLRNGTATIGGTAYTRSGTTIRRLYHSGAWTNTPYVFPIVSADISDATSAATANTVVRRDASGGAKFNDLLIFNNVIANAENGKIEAFGEYTQILASGTQARINTEGEFGHIQTKHVGAAVKSTNFQAYTTAGAALRNSADAAVLTWGVSGQNLTFTAGTAVTFNATTYTYGTGAAAAHRTSLGLTSLATTTPGTGVATLLAGTPSGTGGVVGNTSPTITTAIAKGAGTTTGTAFSVQNSAATVKAIIRDDGNYGVNGYVPSSHVPTSGYSGIWMDSSNCGVIGETGAGFRGINLTANATRSAGSWTQQDATRNSFMLTLGYESSNNGLNLLKSAAGSGNTFAALFTVDSSGNTTIAGTITTAGPASSTARPMKFGSVTSITDAAMVALGFTSQQKVEINAVAYWVPMKTSAWT